MPDRPISWQENAGLLDLFGGMTPRPLPAQALFAPGPSAQSVPGYPLSNADEPTSIRTPDRTAVPATLPTPRSSFDAFLEQSRRTAPTIIQGGVQSQDFAIPESMFPSAPAGYRRAIMANGGPSVYQQILPEERTANGQDSLRQGRTMAEIQQANPGASPAELLALRAQMQRAAQAAAVENFMSRNETANRNTGVLSNREAVAQQLANSTERRNANEARSSRQQLIDSYIMSGRTTELPLALAMHDQAVAHNLANPPATSIFSPAASNPAAPAPASAPAQNLLQLSHEDILRPQLDSLLRQALVGANAPGAAPAARGEPHQPIGPLATTVPAEIGNNAITNFVSSLQNNGLMTEANRPLLHRFISQNFPGHVNRWFREGTATSGNLPSEIIGYLRGEQRTPHQDAANAMLQYLNRGGANIGMTPTLAERMLSAFDLQR